MRMTTFGGVAVTAGILVGTVLGPAGAAAEDPLARRVAELERLVVRDPNHPDSAVMEKLAAVEQSLKLGGPGDIKTPDDLKAAVMKLTASQTLLADRVKALEAAAKTAVSDRAIEDLRRALDDQRKELRDLQQRVQRIRNN